MPVYNGEDVLESSIESVSKQTIKDLELICVDDGSTDNSLNKLHELQEKYDFIRILTQENQGSGKARNYGIDEAKGEYIGFLDADDIFVDEDALERMYELAKAQDADFVAGNLMELLPNGKLVYNENYTDNNYYEFKTIEKIHPREYGVPWAFYKNIYKKSFLDEKNIRFKDLIRGQDPVFLAEILVNVDEIYGIPVILYAYLFPRGNAFKKVNTYKKKLDYVTHYKQTFDIFENYGLKELSEKYKPKFLNYTRSTVRFNDLEAYEIIMEVFGKDNNYFEKHKARYFYFRISHILNKINLLDSEEYFLNAKEGLSDCNYWNNRYLTINQQRLLAFINHCETYEEYKEGYPNIHILNLIEENKKLKREYKSLKKEVKNNNEKLKSVKMFNKSLLDSSSWKLTSHLRKN